MDHEAIARAARRRRALEALEFERQREVALAEQLEEIVAEAHGPAVDDAAFARMEPDDVAIVRAELGDSSDEHDAGDEEESFLLAFGEVDEDEDQESFADEVSRLSAEIEASRSRQRAFEAYLVALDG